MLTLILSPTFTDHLTITGNNVTLKKQKYYLRSQVNVKGKKIEQIVKLSNNHFHTANDKSRNKKHSMGYVLKKILNQT